jgi:1,5-anhydro-D-fructose reductase (1,5-anhydro-D-mannitol-forming)
VAASLGVPLASSADEFWDWQPDAVIICTETARHRPWVEAAAQAGVAVLCEKPLATSIADAEAIVAACEAAGVLLMTAYPVGFHPAFHSLAKAVGAGAIGRVIAASGTNNGAAPIGDRQWFGDAELAGGGALMDHVVHLADLLDVVVPAPAIRVYAQTNRVLHADRTTVETGGLVAISYADGTQAVLDCSWSVPPGYPAWGGLSLRVEGSSGAVEFEPFGERMALYGTVARWPDYGPDLDQLMLAEFLGVAPVPTGRPDCARSGSSLPPSGRPRPGCRSRCERGSWPDRPSGRMRTCALSNSTPRSSPVCSPLPRRWSCRSPKRPGWCSPTI